MKEISSELDKIAELLKAGKVKIFCGAGISFNSGVPLVEPLVREILTALGATPSEIDVFKKANYPFEALMGEIGYSYEGKVANITIGILNRLFKIGCPNSNHYFISHLYKNGMIDKVVTTNFDCLIEKALDGYVSCKVFVSEDEFDKINWKVSDKTLIKVHGSISKVDSIRTTLEEVSSNILHTEREKIVSNTFFSGSHEAVLVLGYSFSDHFDITKFLSKPEYRGGSKQVFIVDHNYTCVPCIKNIPEVFPHIKSLKGKVIQADTDNIVQYLWEKSLSIPYDVSINQKAKQHKNDWYNIIEEFKKLSNKNKAYKTFLLGTLFQNIHQGKISKKYFKEIANSKCNDIFKGKAYIGLSNIYKAEFETKLMVDAVRKAFKIATAMKNESGLIICHTHFSFYYRRTGEYEKALQHNMQAIKIIKRSKIYIRERRIYELSKQHHYIGIILHSQKKYIPAQEQFEISRSISEAIGYEYGVAHALIGKAKIDLAKSNENLNLSTKLDLRFSAFIQLVESLRLSRLIGDKTLVIDNLLTIGQLFVYNKHLNKLREAERIAEEIGNTYYLDLVKSSIEELLTIHSEKQRSNIG